MTREKKTKIGSMIPLRAADLEDIKKRLAENPLENISHLKMIESYGEVIQSFAEVDGPDWGAVLLLPVAASPFDRATYPEAEFVVYLAGSGLPVERLLTLIPRKANLIFKLQRPELKTLLERNGFELTRQRAYITYSCPSGSNYSFDREVAVGQQPDGRLIPLWEWNGYVRKEIEGYFAKGAYWYAVHDLNGLPACACLTFPNHGRVWEIGAVHTVEEQRRRGLARKVVSSALAHLLSMDFIPRYQAAETNSASIRLAEAIGLKEIVRLEHYRYEPPEV